MNSNHRDQEALWRDDAHWKWGGLFYHCAADRRILVPSKLLKNVGEAGVARQKSAKGGSLYGINDRPKPTFNLATATQIVFRWLAKHSWGWTLNFGQRSAFLVLIATLLAIFVPVGTAIRDQRPEEVPMAALLSVAAVIVILVCASRIGRE